MQLVTRLLLRLGLVGLLMLILAFVLTLFLRDRTLQMKFKVVSVLVN